MPLDGHHPGKRSMTGENILPLVVGTSGSISIRDDWRQAGGC
jgi:hypothetical protein